MKRRGGGKAKGSAFERLVCKRLSLYVTHGKSDDVFWRSAMSGGRATVSASKGRKLSHVSGDLCATHPDGYPFIAQFYVECKSYKDLQYKTLVTSNSGRITTFWLTAMEQAADNNKTPVLILKQNQMPTLVGVEDDCPLVHPVKHTPLAWFPKLGLQLYLFEELFKHESAPRITTSRPVVSKQPNNVRPTLNRKPA